MGRLVREVGDEDAAGPPALFVSEGGVLLLSAESKGNLVRSGRGTLANH